MNETAPRPGTRSGTERERLSPPPSFGTSGTGGTGGTGPVNAEQAAAVGEWIKWHAVELAGVGVPLVLALAVSTWFAVLAVPAAGLWAAQATRRTRRHAQLRRGERAALTSTDTTTTDTSSTTGSEEKQQ